MKTCQPNGTWERREGMEWTNYQPCLNFAVSSDYLSCKYEASTDFATKYVQQNKIKVFLMNYVSGLHQSHLLNIYYN